MFAEKNKGRYSTPPQLMRVTEVAKKLCVSRSMAYKLVQQGDLPSVRIGKSVRVRPIDLQNYIESRLI